MLPTPLQTAETYTLSSSFELLRLHAAVIRHQCLLDLNYYHLAAKLYLLTTDILHSIETTSFDILNDTQAALKCQEFSIIPPESPLYCHR